MFSVSAIALLAVGIVVVLITPGPTNTLLASAGLRQGVRRSLPLIAAELAGYLVAISVWGRFLAQAAHALPWLPALLRVAAGTYIAWLAVDMWRAAVALPDSTQKASGTLRLFLATLLNPKALLFAGTIFPAAAFVLWPAYLLSMLIFACLLAPIALAWIAFGAALGSGKLGWLDPAKIQRGASVVLGVFSLTLAWSALH
ncbi:threonine/homoserine/homoserine lactone efflux protein [Paraburkholderia sp. GV068]|uniref:LysE family translocator n=1 Tax=unclassified Paraburkholderia TaxID=2615204 RepID=UPI000D30913D|nr:MULTISPECIES: LysE family transporter [unclassified Paraburkholderia]PTQ92511.1 threonine/homoserine/homoserine lactone efflux protein [Paraburkholderia sp. GV072]PUA94741.1 threonine/homoserine/homoserine lactone efflux protein [Paraburkholderia sp. GV068]